MSNELYLRNKLSIYQKIYEEQNKLIILYEEALSLRKQYLLSYGNQNIQDNIQRNKEELSRVKNEIHRLKDRLILFCNTRQF